MLIYGGVTVYVSGHLAMIGGYIELDYEKLAFICETHRHLSFFLATAGISSLFFQIANRAILRKMFLGDVVPDFKADSTEGAISFYDWLGDS